MSTDPKVGDICKGCMDHWDNQGKQRRHLVLIGSTQNKKVMVLVCPYCDGERAIELARTSKSE